MDCITESQLLALFDDRLPPALREAIEGHIDDCPQCRGLVVGVARGLGSLASPPAPTPTSDAALAPPGAGSGLEAGATVDDRYVLLDRVGMGGMGIVYAAYDRKLDRKVALKLLRPDVGSVGDARARLLREAQLIARLSHPNIISVHDAGEYNGQIYIDMEFVEGCNLRQWLAAAPRPVPEVVRVFLEAARGLVAAHAAGVIHRDFKPDNVLVGVDGRIRVNDFGLARSQARPESLIFDAMALVRESRTELETRGDVTIGTPAYMAPEQRRGESATAAVDQYAFCVALHEALLGERPAAAGSAGRVGDARLAELLRRGLGAAPEDRFTSMEALATALAAVTRRRRWPWIAGALGVAVALGLGLASASEGPNLCQGGPQYFAGLWDAPRKEALREVFTATGASGASRSFAAVEGALDRIADTWVAQHLDACEATQVRGEQSAELLDRRMACLREGLGEVEVVLSLLAEADAKIVERAPELVGNVFDPARCDAAAVLRDHQPLAPLAIRERVEEHQKQVTRSLMLGIAGRPKEALALAQQAVDEGVALGFTPSEQKAVFVLGRAQMIDNDFAAAEASFRRAALLAEESAEDDKAVDAWLALTWNAMAQVRHEEAGLWLRLVEAKLRRLGEDSRLYPSRRAHLLQWRADLDLAQNRMAAAIAGYEEALALRRRDPRTHPSAIASSLNGLGNLTLRQGEVDRAMARFQEALAIHEREFGPVHPRVAGTLNNIGMALLAQCHHAEARGHFERALAIRVGLSGEDKPEIAAVLINLALLEEAQGRREQAQATVERSMAIVVRFLGEEHPLLVPHLALRSRLRLAAGAAEEALALAERALAIVVKHHSATHLDAGEPTIAMGSALLALGRDEQALRTLEQAWSIYIAEPSRAEWRARAAFALARALAARGQHARALEAVGWAEAALPLCLEDEWQALRAWKATHAAAAPG